MSLERKYRLPGILQEIAEAAGLAAALEIARVKGGTNAYFPARPGPRHWLSTTVGHDKALTIGRALAPGQSGIELLVPMGPSASQAARWRRMRELIDAGASAAQIARAVGCHARTAKKHRNGQVPTADALLAQGDLFES
ncbi:MAG: helix-turn-helix domain-containing protein [Gammaproteobacteria bacterium]